MSDTIKAYALNWVGVMLSLVLILLTIYVLVHDYQVTQREAIKAGLVEVPNAGSGYHWGKPAQ